MYKVIQYLAFLLFVILFSLLSASCQHDNNLEGEYKALNKLAFEIIDFQNAYMKKLDAVSNPKKFQSAFDTARKDAETFIEVHKQQLEKYPSLASHHISPRHIPKELQQSYGVVLVNQFKIAQRELALQMRFKLDMGLPSLKLRELIKTSLLM